MVQEPVKSKPAAVHDDEESDFELPVESQKKKSKLPPVAPFVIEIYRYSNASDLLGFVGSPLDIVILVVFMHEAFPSVLFKFQEAVTKFCNEKQAEDKTFPAEYKELEKGLKVKFVMTPNQPKQDQVAYRRGVYMCYRDLKKLIDFLDTFAKWRVTKSVDGHFENVTIDVKDCTGMNRITTDLGKQDYENEIKFGTAAAKALLPSTIFTVPSPLWAMLHPEIVFTRLDENYVRISFQGETFTFKSAFIDMNVQGRYEYLDGTPIPDDALEEEKKKGHYVRTIKRIDMSNVKKKNFLVAALADTVPDDCKTCRLTLKRMHALHSVSVMMQSANHIDLPRQFSIIDCIV